MDALWSTPNALYIGDFSSADGFADGTGIIYKLEATATPEPGTIGLAAMGMLLLACLRGNRLQLR